MKRTLNIVSRGLMILCLWLFFMHSYAQQTITIGQKAPEISVKTWLKGSPVKQFEPGRVYLVEFWATWCKPCIELMPHLSELARKYKDKVEVVGINILDRSPRAKIVNFIVSMGDKMDYTVGLDDGFMIENWFMPAGSGGIPKSFIVDQRGNLVWYGNEGIDEVLMKVLRGESVAESGEKIASSKPGGMYYLFMPQSESISKAAGKLSEFIKSKDYNEALSYYHTLKKDSAATAAGVFGLYFNALIEVDTAKALAVYKNLLLVKDRWQYWISWKVVHHAGLEKEFYSQAKNLLEPAALDKSWSGQPLVREGLAEAYYRLGEVQQAMEVLQKWIDKLKSLKGGEEMLREAESRLDRYKVGL